MHYEVIEDKNTPDTWRVEAIGHTSDGEVYVAIFSGPGARDRAMEYGDWKNHA